MRAASALHSPDQKRPARAASVHPVQMRSIGEALERMDDQLAVVGAGWISKEAFLPGVAQSGKFAGCRDP